MKAEDLFGKICRCHRSDDQTAKGVFVDFLWPKFSKGFLIRLVCVALAALFVFGWMLRPCVIRGASMEPTVHRTGFTFCWRLRYLFSEPRRGDIVILRYTDKVYYLKRIVALPGETVSFRRGMLYVNGKAQYESYVKFVCYWNMPPRTVEPGHYYVVGDNRSMPMEEHVFGSVSARKIEGGPLWY